MVGNESVVENSAPRRSDLVERHLAVEQAVADNPAAGTSV
jgi:hypothetical protein